jgi:hypothetical protein
MYRIRDLQFETRYFADGQVFKNKSDIVDQLANYHDNDFEGSDDKENELDIYEYFKFWKLNTIQKQLKYLLQYGEWKLEKV